MPTRLFGLVLVTPRAFAIALVTMRQRKRRQPGFAAHGPQFVGGLEPVGGVEGAEVEFDFVAAAAEHRRAAVRAEVAVAVVAGVAFDADRVGGEDRRGVEQGAVVFAAVQAVAQADPVGPAGGDDADLAAQAAGGGSVHADASYEGER